MAIAQKKLVQWEPTDIKKELLKKYPAKVARKRAKQILINEALENTPELCNSDPFGDGWIVRVKLAHKPGGLMDAAAYEAHCASEKH